MRKIALSLLTLLLYACSTSSKENQNEVTDSVALAPLEQAIDPFKLESYLTTSQGDTSLMQMVEDNTAIFIYPTEAEVSEMEKEYGEDFATIADDASFYQSESSMLMDSLGVKTIFTAKPLLQLRGKTKTWNLDVKKSGLSKWNLILFHTRKDPFIISTVGLDADTVKSYFGLKVN